VKQHEFTSIARHAVPLW